MSKVNITTPVGRMVMGSLYNPNTTDMDGKPLTVKTGPNAGQARVDYFFALAIPKGAETHWAQTPWGQQIYAVGAASFPSMHQTPTFAWKIEDGDSQVPNRRGRKPCENEGWAGHWILKLSGGFAPRIYKMENGGYVQVTEPDFIKPGYYVQVALTADSNNSQQQPGIYLNHSMVCFSAYGTEIVFGPNVNEAGFGQAPLPQGASLTPPPSAAPMPAPPPSAAPMPAPIPVVPAPQFVQVPPPAPAAPVRQMTALAAGATYEAFISQGWTDEQLIAKGYMTA